MSLTRKKLKALNLSDDVIDTVIEEHTEVVNGLKADIEKYKGEAEKLPGVQKELDDLKAKGGDDYKKKYEDEKAAFEKFKNEQTAKETRSTKERAYRELLKAAGVEEKRMGAIIRVTDIDGLEVGTDGKIKDADNLTESIKTEWADFVVTTTEKGAPTVTPPKSGPGVDLGELSMADYIEKRKSMKG